MNRTLVVMALFFSFASLADSKCLTTWYEVSGVVSEPNGAAIPDAEISVVWSELGGKANRTQSVRTGDQGNYVVRLPFYSGTGANTMSRDVCTATLAHVKVSVSAHGHEPVSGAVAITNAQVTANYSLKRTAADGLR